jgi:hypothetical protein
MQPLQKQLINSLPSTNGGSFSPQHLSNAFSLPISKHGPATNADSKSNAPLGLSPFCWF